MHIVAALFHIKAGDKMGIILGTGYRARVGKDTVGDYLEQQKGWRRTCFAASLKEAAKIIFGWTDEHVYGKLKEAIDPFWGFSPREALQKLGTDACRNHIHRDIWVKSVERRIKSDPEANWIVTDARFPNEVEAIKAWGGFVVRIDREFPDEISTVGHESEHALDTYKHWDEIISNNGTFQELYLKIEESLEKLEANKLASSLILKEF